MWVTTILLGMYVGKKVFDYFSIQRNAPKYLLEPDADGNYTLRRYDAIIGYTYVTSVRSKEDADLIIKNLERETIYYVEDEKS